jgi:hypothetical protein
MIATSYAKLMCSVLLAAAPIFAVISIAVAQQPPSLELRGLLRGGPGRPRGSKNSFPRGTKQIMKGLLSGEFRDGDSGETAV